MMCISDMRGVGGTGDIEGAGCVENAGDIGVGVGVFGSIFGV